MGVMDNVLLVLESLLSFVEMEVGELTFKNLSCLSKGREFCFPEIRNKSKVSKGA